MQPKKHLVLRNIDIFERRTSARLEPEIWKSLEDVAKREKCSINNIVSLIDLCREEKSSLAGAIRVFLVLYYKVAATEEGHQKAGHGNFENMKKRCVSHKRWEDLFNKKLVSSNNHNTRMDAVFEKIAS